ncbi:stAR-related lipid transfer protein 7, mitochondrial isoform X1 [Brienomyrus brachyistius]|uniref:stAR-related lipid transfer protein 7, mitochondrial isoform X1 n=1 Tax=Brienomyrus brachyistius TaxID=42636 RepID=UPI0020B2474F|nr:stAR-related lipid transfer protein 7, mitochondrial isoform X1 [Brienomyrus brachyistius]XP_048876587.1 stAR-related lipid transfer protein 7, mitochondrial isoform X1 [Brienomyrus brachyistius]
MFPFFRRRPIFGITARIQTFSGFCSEKLWKSRNGAGEWLGSRLSCLYKAGAKGSGHDNRRKTMFSLLANQCSFVTGQRLRRAYQIGELYSNLYAEHTRWSLVGSFWYRFQNKHCKVGKLVAALAGIFLWEDEKIRDEEIRRSAEELQMMEQMKNQTPVPAKTRGQEDSGWEIVMEKKNFWVWRKPILNGHLYEYRVLGTYNDITPRQFFNVQLDTEYRKKWDSLVIKLEVVDRDASTGTEVVHWATHFPYPMYSRDYVYVRRYDVDVEKNLMVLVSRAVEHPLVPETKDFVRVQSYQSRMVIRPHRSFDENGFDYLLTYRDDPQTAIPRYCVSWMVSSGMPDFLEKLHAAALRARNQEVGMQDYMSMVKPVQEYHSAETGRAGGPGRMEYA